MSLNLTLIKEDNRITEQMYSVAIYVKSSGIGLHCNLLMASVMTITLDNQEEHSFSESQNITFPFYLNHDTLPEGTETFQASAAANNGFPTFKTPTNLFANTLINIIDNDGKILVTN